MACGRPKNLEIAARNLLCGPGDRRRNSPTTGTVTGEGETLSHGKGETPKPPAKGKSGPSGKEKPGATGEEETLSHPARGKPRATRAMGNPEASGQGRSPAPPRQGGK